LTIKQRGIPAVELPFLSSVFPFIKMHFPLLESQMNHNKLKNKKFPNESSWDIPALKLLFTVMMI
jgi:hypothetical protein